MDARELRLGSVAVSRLASLRFTVAEIAHKALDNPGWGLAAVARDLKAAVADDVGAA